MASFTIEDCEFDFGDFSLGGDWLVEIESDGHDFDVIEVISCKRSQTGLVVEMVKEWVSGDLAKPKPLSRVRKAYQRKLEEPSAVSADRADFAHDERLNARAA